MKDIKKEKQGFSLAEALITLLIVCLITLASIPILTKKKREISKYPSGSWICTKDSSGNHIVYSSVTDAWTQTGDRCVFYPPVNARNFEVIAVGGGGGGASGYSDVQVKKLYGNGYSAMEFTAPADGEYEITAIGGGGQGGKRQNNARRCKENPGGPGGSGGFVNKIVNLKRGTTYSLKAGEGGSGGGYNGGAGGSSYVRMRKGSSYEYIVEATGGGGGSGKWGPACGKGDSDSADSNWGRRGDAGSPSGVKGTIEKRHDDNNHVRTTGGALCKTANLSSKSQLKGYSVAGMNCNKFLTDSRYLGLTTAHNLRSGNGYMEFDNVYSLPYGYGGAGHDSSGDRDPSGGPGLLIMYYNIIYSGDGGKASVPARPPVYPQIKKLTARIGDGGTGATTANSSGGAGGRTEYVIETQDREIDGFATGGAGGTPQFATRASASETGFIRGEYGGTSEVKPLKSNATGGAGGFAYDASNPNGQTLPTGDKNYFGAGGGGGGANDTKWGTGGNGAPGAVLISW